LNTTKPAKLIVALANYAEHNDKVFVFLGAGAGPGWQGLQEYNNLARIFAADYLKRNLWVTLTVYTLLYLCNSIATVTDLITVITLLYIWDCHNLM